jgi:hypothetical protein
MAGGEIFNKTGILRNLSGIDVDAGNANNFTGIFGGPRSDKMLIINSKYLYQVPWSFGSNWNKIKIGAFLSYTIAGNPNQGVDDEDIINSGTTTNENFTWIGIGVNSQTKTLPLNANNQGFVGYVCNQIQAFNDIDTDDQQRGFCLELSTIAGNTDVSTNPTTRGRASGIATFGNNILGGSIIKVAIESNGDLANDTVNYDTELSQGVIHVPIASQSLMDDFDRGVFCPDDQGEVLGNDSARKINNYYTKFFGMEFEVLNKGTNEQKIKMSMIKSGIRDYVGTSQVNPYNATSDATSGALEELLTNDSKGTVIQTHPHATGLDQVVGNRTMTGMPFTGTDGTALDLPNSFMFYNAFSTIRPRISAWGVKKIS